MITPANKSRPHRPRATTAFRLRAPAQGRRSLGLGGWTRVPPPHDPRPALILRPRNVGDAAPCPTPVFKWNDYGILFILLILYCRVGRNTLAAEPGHNRGT